MDRLPQREHSQWWEMTPDEFLDHHRTYLIDDYDGFNLEEIKEKLGSKSEYQVLVHSARVDGLDIEIRQSTGSRKYGYTDENDRDQLDEGMMGIFMANDPIGFLGESHGASEIFIAEELQNRGLGTIITKIWLETYRTRDDKLRVLGQMSAAGESITLKAHKEIVKDAIARGDPVPDIVLEHYPDLVPKIPKL